MFARPLTNPNRETNTVAFDENRMLLRGDAPHQLPQGNWVIEVTKGDAWIFAGGYNTPVRAGEYFDITPQDGEATIHHLYRGGNVHYTIKAAL